MGQVGTHFTSAGEATCASAFFCAFTAFMAYVNYDNYLNNKIDYLALSSLAVSVAITGLAVNNAYYCIFEGEV